MMANLTPEDKPFEIYREDNLWVLLVRLDAAGREYRHELNSGETYRYESQGDSFLAQLAREIRENPEGFGKVVEQDDF